MTDQPATDGRRFESLHPETVAVRPGSRPHAQGSGPVSQPLVLSSTFFHESTDGADGHIYGRLSNPNRLAFEEALAALEGGEWCTAFASGSAASMAILHLLKPGSRVLFHREVYHGTRKLANEIMARWGLVVEMCDMTQPSCDLDHGVYDAVWIETPSNPSLDIIDVKGWSAAARRAGALSVVDNTWATPLLMRPLDLGAHLVLHSTSKYIGGHTDMIGGAVIGAAGTADLHTATRLMQQQGGAVPSPFDCWLGLRGLQTLPVRLRQQCATAATLAERLAAHPAVEAVLYPGLPGHPNHGLAAEQMKHFGAMMSVRVKGGAAVAIKVANSTSLFSNATSLGGVESLIEHRASVEGPHTTTAPDLLRISVGLEHVDDLWADLKRALVTAA